MRPPPPLPTASPPEGFCAKCSIPAKSTVRPIWSADANSQKFAILHRTPEGGENLMCGVCWAISGVRWWGVRFRCCGRPPSAYGISPRRGEKIWSVGFVGRPRGAVVGCAVWVLRPPSACGISPRRGEKIWSVGFVGRSRGCGGVECGFGVAGVPPLPAASPPGGGEKFEPEAALSGERKFEPAASARGGGNLGRRQILPEEKNWAGGGPLGGESI